MITGGDDSDKAMVVAQVILAITHCHCDSLHVRRVRVCLISYFNML